LGAALTAHQVVVEDPDLLEGSAQQEVVQPLWKGIPTCKAMSQGIPVDTVAQVDDNIVESYKGKIITSDLWLMPSRLYIVRVSPGPGYLMCSHAITLSPSLGADPVACVNLYKSRKPKKISDNRST
jgi:hypothetical protein